MDSVSPGTWFSLGVILWSWGLWFLTRPLSAELVLHFLNLRSSIIRDQEQRKVRTCIPYNLTNAGAALEGARWAGGNYTRTVQNKSCWRLLNTTFSLLCWMFGCLVLWFLGWGAGRALILPCHLCCIVIISVRCLAQVIATIRRRKHNVI